MPMRRSCSPKSQPMSLPKVSIHIHNKVTGSYELHSQTSLRNYRRGGSSPYGKSAPSNKVNHPVVGTSRNRKKPVSPSTELVA